MRIAALVCAAAAAPDGSRRAGPAPKGGAPGPPAGGPGPLPWVLSALLDRDARAQGQAAIAGIAIDHGDHAGRVRGGRREGERIDRAP